MNKKEYKFLKHFIKKNIDEKQDYYWKKGYEIFGPLLYSYARWLEKNFNEKKYDNIFFFSRDGYIMQKAFEIVNKKYKTKYFYASRRALIVPTLWIYDKLEDLFDIMFFDRNMSMKAFLGKIGLIPNNYISILKEYGYSLEQEIDIYEEKNKDKFQELYYKLKDDINKNSKQEYNNLIKYLNDNNFKNKIAIVDIGWYGNMQNAIQKIVNIEKIDAQIDGYYVGIVPDSLNQDVLSMRGFLFEKNKNEKMFLEKKYFNSIFEIVFMAHHGSVKRYTDKGPELYDFEYKNTEAEEKINKFQQGAIQFVIDYNNYEKKEYEIFSEYVCMKNFLEFGNRPSNYDIEEFRNITFYSDDFYKLIPDDISIKYLLKPKKFITEFKKSPWKTAFLKKIFKVRINYVKIIMFLRLFKK